MDILKLIFKRQTCVLCKIRPGSKSKDGKMTMNMCSHCWNKGLK